MEKTYFIYRYIRHDKNEPFYIGMGTLFNGFVFKEIKIHNIPNIYAK